MLLFFRTGISYAELRCADSAYILLFFIQGFGMLDVDRKGYLTAEDLRKAADSQKISLSNRAIREMIQEADISGDNKVSPEEFVHIMLQCSLFKTTC